MNDEGIKPGDTVSGLWIDKYRSGYTVDKVDTERGRVWVTNESGKQEILSILEVTKVLD